MAGRKSAQAVDLEGRKSVAGMGTMSAGRCHLMG